ncbi:MAG: hypothetical protein JO089_04320 [Alphaproteobacteria bacterium]|nr:hypothetical protein [Alphaproteobacteria bacterium]
MLENKRAGADASADHPSSRLHATPSSLEQTVAEHLRRYFAAHEGSAPPPGLHGRILACVERPLIAAALHATAGNQVKAAHLLGLNRNTLRKKMQELGVDAPGARRRA